MTQGAKLLPRLVSFSWIALTACSGPPGQVQPVDAAVLPDAELPDTWPDCVPTAEQQTVTFVHTGDLHATYTPDAPGESPVSRIRGFYEWTRWESPYTVFTDAGDAHEKGSVAELLSAGAATREIVRAMGYHVRVIGNHDFAWSLAELLAFSGDPHALVLASNTTYDGTSGFGAEAYGELDVGCVRIGFFGMVSRPWNERNEQFDGPYYPELDTRYDFTTRAEEIVADHLGEVDLLVMVSHLELATDEGLAEDVPGIDVVLGGHTHAALEAPLIRGDDTLIVHTGAYARYVARLDVDLDLRTGDRLAHRYELVPNDVGSLPAEAELQAVVEQVMATYAPEALHESGRLAADRAVAEIAELTARAAVHHLAVDAAIVDQDTVWQSWSAGPLTQQDLADTFRVERQPVGTPGFNSFYVVSVLGEDLVWLRYSLSLAFALVGPEQPDPTATYLLALQKHAVFDPDAYLPPEVEIVAPAPASEAWAVLDAYARFRADSCLHLDVDTPLPDCLP
ncbi:MAG: metallophosphoesterase [bacterium]